MPVASNKFTLTADGNFDLGSAPTVGQTDVFCVNSNTVIEGLSDPTGGAAITAAESAVTNQGAYIFVRKATGGEGQTVDLNMSGTNHPTQVTWSRWNSLDVVDTSTSTQVNGSVGVATPAHSTGTMAEAGEVCVAFAALHSTGSANQSTPAWTNDFISLFDAPAVQGSGATGVVGWVAYKENVGTAAETPQVSWSGDGCQNRYALTVTFTLAGQTVAVGTATETDTAGTLGRVKTRVLGAATETDSAGTLGAAKVLALGTAVETDTALSLGLPFRAAGYPIVTYSTVDPVTTSTDIRAEAT